MLALRRPLPLTALAALGVAVLIMLGLYAMSSATAQTASAAPAGQSLVRVVHASPDTPAVDVYVNGTKTISALTFFSATTYLGPLPAGSYNVSVTLAGQSQAALSATLALEGGKDYSVVANGTLAPADAAPLTVTALVDDNRTPAANRAALRVVHAAPDAPAVDVLVNGTRVVSGAGFFGASSYLPVAPGTYTVNIAPASGSATPNAPIYTTSLTLAAGQVATAWANGLLTPGNQAQAFKVSSTVDSSSVRVRAVHASPDTPPVDIYIDGTKTISELTFFEASRYLGPLPAGRYRVQVVPAGLEPTPANSPISTTVELTSGLYSIAAIGTLTTTDNLTLTASVIRDDNSAPPAGQARLRVAHVAPDAPAVNILVNGTPVITGATYPNVTGYLTVAPGTYTIGVVPTSSGSPLTPIYSTTITLGAGQVATAWANGLLETSNAAQAFKVTPTIDNQARVRALHASPDTPAVDIYVNGARALTNISFGEISSYLPLVEGSAVVSVTLSGQTDTVLSQSYDLLAGNDYTIAAIGTLAPNDDVVVQAAPLTLTAILDDNTRPASGARIRVVHLAPDVPSASNTAVDVRANGTLLFDDVTYGTATNYQPAPAGAVTVTISAGNSTTPVLTQNQTLQPGSVNTLFVIGRTLPGVPASRQLRVLSVADIEAPSIDRLPIVFFQHPR